jgi:putative peptide zinc metalloprotease protein
MKQGAVRWDAGTLCRRVGVGCSKYRRALVGAGIYVELMIAAIATFIWWNTPSQPFVNYLSLSLMIVCSVSTVIFNGNPLMRYDGYYIYSRT